MVGAADIVALADIDVAMETEEAEEVEYAGNVGRTNPAAELDPAAAAVGLKSGPTGAEDSVTFVCQQRSVDRQMGQQRVF